MMRELKAYMKSAKSITVAALLSGILITLWFALAAAHEHQGRKKTAKLKPYPLNTCAVSGEQPGRDMGKPFVDRYIDREIKVCCKDCLKDFAKDPAPYLKKIEAAEKKAKNI